MTALNLQLAQITLDTLHTTPLPSALFNSEVSLVNLEEDTPSAVPPQPKVPTDALLVDALKRKPSTSVGKQYGGMVRGMIDIAWARSSGELIDLANGLADDLGEIKNGWV